MLFAEPPRTQYDLNFTLWGFSVRIHPFFWIVSLLLGAQGDPKPVIVLLWVLAVFFSILLHELGHALAFRYFGWDSHIVLYAAGGLAIADVGWGGRSPYGASRTLSPWSQIVVSLAGPIIQLLLAAVLILGLYLSGLRLPILGHYFWPGEPFAPNQQNIAELIFSLLYINIFWALINLLPVFPLDGGQVFRQILCFFNPSDGLRQSLMLSVFTSAGLAVLAIVKLQSVFLALVFGYLAYTSYAALRSFTGGSRGW